MIKRIAAVATAIFLSSGIAHAAYMGTAPLTVANGGTGQTTLTQYDVLLGAGSSGIATAGPTSTSGSALVSNGTSSNPSFGTVLPYGGGTGLSNPTVHGLLVAEGSANFNQLAAAANSIPLWQTSSADPTVTAIGSCSSGTSALTYNTSTYAFGCNTISPNWTETTYTSTTTPVTLASTVNLFEVISQTTAAAITVKLPTGMSAGNIQCVKDGTNNFATYNATLESAGSANLDGSSTYVMNQQHQEACFVYDGTNWWIGI